MQFVPFYLFSCFILLSGRGSGRRRHGTPSVGFPTSLHLSASHVMLSRSISPVNTNSDTCCMIDSDTVSTSVSLVHRAVFMLHAPICLHIYITVGVAALTMMDLCVLAVAYSVLRTSISSALDVPKWIPSCSHGRSSTCQILSVQNLWVSEQEISSALLWPDLV